MPQLCFFLTLHHATAGRMSKSLKHLILPPMLSWPTVTSPSISLLLCSMLFHCMVVFTVNLKYLHPKQKYPIRSVYACLFSCAFCRCREPLLVFSRTISALSNGAMQNRAQNNVFNVSDRLVKDDA